jgi:beta-galactosidase
LRLEVTDRASGATEGAVVATPQLLLRAESRELLVRGDFRPGGAVEVDGEGLLLHPALVTAPQLCLWRAGTDNDRIGGFADRWNGLGVDRLRRLLLGVEHVGAAIRVSAEYRTTPTGAAAGSGHEPVAVRHEQVLTPVVLPDGRPGVWVEEAATLPAELADLPRVGTVLETVAGYQRLDWFGRGPFETYPDRASAGHVGLFGCGADEWHTPYLRPQENGGRNGVRWLRLAGESVADLTITCDEPRQVSVTRFRAQDLAAASHPQELVAQPGHVIHLDTAHRGLGTASCGPDTLPQYLIATGVHRWSYVLS